MRWAIIFALVVVLAAALAAMVRLYENPNELWVFVKTCVKANERRQRLPPGCIAVDSKNNVAILRSPFGRWDYLAVPTVRLRGIEDPQVLNPRLPNYWELAWSAAYKYLPASATRDRAHVGLAVNSAASRTENQLHIHFSCVKPRVMALLAADQDRISTTWSSPFFRSGNAHFRVMRVYGATLEQTNPFILLARSRGAAAEMGRHTLVVTGAVWGTRPGFYILDDYARDPTVSSDNGHGEDLLNKSCVRIPGALRVVGNPASKHAGHQ